MADARLTRFSAEALGVARSWASVTRQGIQVALEFPGANSAAFLRTTRVDVEALGVAPVLVSVTRQGVQAALEHPGARTDIEARCTRVGVEALGEAPEIASVTRQGLQVALAPLGVNPGASILTTRFAYEVLARAFVPIDPFTPPEGWTFFLHNWMEGCSIESSYSTDITDSVEEVCEERTGLVQKPSRLVRVSWVVKGNQQAIETVAELRRLVREESAIPLYPDAIYPTAASTSGTNYVLGDFSLGRYLAGVPVVIASFSAQFDGLEGGAQTIDYEVRTIQARLGDRIQFVGVLENSYPANRTVVIPLIQTHPKVEITYGLTTNNMIEIEAEFLEIYGPTAISELASGITTTDQYGGYPVLALKPDWSEGIEHTIRREGDRSALGRGVVVYQRGERGRLLKQLDFIEDREGAWDMLRFFDSRKGRLLPFWLVDLDLVYTLPLISTTKVVVSKLGTFEAFSEEMDYFGLVMSDGRVYVREVGALQELAGSWEVYPTTDLPAGYAASDVVGFGRARLCRQESDALTESWSTTGACSFSVPVIELIDEREVT